MIIGRCQNGTVINYKYFLSLRIFSRKDLEDVQFDSSDIDAEYDLWFDSSSSDESDIILWSATKEKCEEVRDYIYEQLQYGRHSALDLTKYS